MILFAGASLRKRLPFYILLIVLVSIVTIQSNQVLLAQDIVQSGKPKGPSGLKAILVFGVSLWEWIRISFGPIVLGFISVFVKRFLAEQDKEKKKQEAELAREARRHEREIAEDRLRREKLKDYLDQMTVVLLRENTLDDDTDELLKAVVRARTIIVLQELEGKRKGAVMRFLEDCNVIKFLDLSKADLQEANLRGVSLKSSCLRKANFQQANLQDVDLSNSNLEYADLTEADLSGANLEETNLQNAIGLTLKQLQTANNWQKAFYDQDLF